jgi:hypothetical protein
VFSLKEQTDISCKALSGRNSHWTDYLYSVKRRPVAKWTNSMSIEARIRCLYYDASVLLAPVVGVLVGWEREAHGADVAWRRARPDEAPCVGQRAGAARAQEDQRGRGRRRRHRSRGAPSWRRRRIGLHRSLNSRLAGKDVSVGADLGLISALVLLRSSLFGSFLLLAPAGGGKAFVFLAFVIDLGKS